MPLKIIRDDITNVMCDAIVNAANCTLLGGGGVDGAIHKAAGKGLLRECMTLGGCRTGQAKITGGYKLPCKYVIHTVGPKWHGGSNGECELLKSCYINSLELAKEYGCESVAFPLISSGVYGYPITEAFRVAADTIADFLMQNDMLVYIVVYNKNALTAAGKIFADITQYIDDNYAESFSAYDAQRSLNYNTASLPVNETICLGDFDKIQIPDEPSCTTVNAAAPTVKAPQIQSNESMGRIIDDMIDESFSEMLLRVIDEKGISDSECYKKANIDRRLFSKIRSNPQYKPSKTTALAFCIALELSLPQTEEMLMKAGFALSHSNKFDIIVEYFIKNGNYNIFEINETLFEFDQSLLGA